MVASFIVNSSATSSSIIFDESATVLPSPISDVIAVFKLNTSSPSTSRSFVIFISIVVVVSHAAIVMLSSTIAT